MKNYTHSCKFYSDEDKHIAVNCLSIVETMFGYSHSQQ